MDKITTLTPEQEADILPTFHKWRDEYSVQNDNAAAKVTVEQIYARIGKKKPLVIFTKSPLVMTILATIWPDFVKRLNKSLHTGIDDKGTSLGASLRASLRDSLGTSLGTSLGASLGTSLGTSLDDSLGTSLGASLGTSLGTSLDDSLRDSLGASLGASLDASLRDSLGASLRASLGASLDASLGASLRASLRDSLGTSLRASLGASLDASLGDSLGTSLGTSLDVRWWFWWYAGFGLIDFVLRHFGNKTSLNLQDSKLWVDVGMNLTRFIPYENVCFVAEKPTRLVWGENNQLSYDHGPAQEYADGYGIYMLDGVRFSKEEWERITNQTFTLEELAKVGMGADKSAIAIKYLRPDLLLEQVKAKLIHTGIKGTRLYQVDNFMNTDKTQYCILMVHPSIDRTYIEWVEPKVGELKDADLAQCNAWKDKDGNPVPLEDYLLAIEA